MSYENAPATLMLATHCAVCRRPLVDSVSVETGMGPDCRERHGFNIDVPAEARAEANKLVHAIALGVDAGTLKLHVLALRCYGFDRLADVLVDRNAAVRITPAGVGYIAVTTPYNPDFVEAFKAALPWRKWDREAKVWLVPDTTQAKRVLWGVLRRFFNGQLGVAPSGLFVVTTGAA